MTSGSGDEPLFSCKRLHTGRKCQSVRGNGERGRASTRDGLGFVYLNFAAHADAGSINSPDSGPPCFFFGVHHQPPGSDLFGSQ